MIAYEPESRRRRRRTRPFQRYVRALLATSILLALAVILTAYLKLGVPSGAGEEAEEARDRQRIERPVYTTRLPNGALLTFSAAYAIPHAAEASSASLRTVDIRGRSRDGRPFSAKSDQGILRVDQGRMVLFGNVIARGPAGERFSGNSLTIDTKAQSAWSHEPVRVRWGQVELEAGAVNIWNAERGMEIEFSNGVRMLYRASGNGG